MAAGPDPDRPLQDASRYTDGQEAADGGPQPETVERRGRSWLPVLLAVAVLVLAYFLLT